MNQRLSNLNNQFSSSRMPMWTLRTFVPFDFTKSDQGDLKGQTVFVTGASRGIGLEIAKRCAKDGANIVIAAKTVTEHPKLPGTIYTAAKEIEALGAKCLPIQCDIRDEKSVEAAIEKTVETFGGLDILINNASAIQPVGVEHMEVKRFDLIMSINTRGTFVASKYAIPHLRKSKNPHILTISPPLYMGNDVSIQPTQSIDNTCSCVASKLVRQDGHWICPWKVRHDSRHTCKSKSHLLTICFV